MKIKWLITALFLVAVILQIPLGLKAPKPLQIEIGEKKVSVAIGKVRVRGSGKVECDSVKLVIEDQTFQIRRLTAHVSLFKVGKLRTAEPILRRHLKALHFDSLTAELIAVGLKKITVEHSSGAIGKTSFTDAFLSFKREGKFVRGSGRVESVVLWGKRQTKQQFDFLLKEEIAKGSFDGSIGGGTAKSQFSYNISTKKFIELAVTAKKIELNQTIPAEFDGTVAIQFKSTNDRSEPFTGEGTISVIGFVDKESALLAELRRTLKLVGVTAVQFDEIRIPFKLANNKLNTDSISAEGKNFDVTGSGTVKLKNLSYDLEVTGHLAPAMQNNVSRIVWGGLDFDAKTGGRSFTGTAIGQNDDYSVKVDKRIIRQGARSFFKNLFN